MRASRRETPVSDARSLRLVSLTDDGALRLTLEDGRDPGRPRWQVTFRGVLGYLNLLEEYRDELWERTSRGGAVGWSKLVPRSPWLALLGRAEPLVSVHHPSAQHYQVATEDDVIDVFTSTEPVWEALAPAPAGSAPAGKSTVLYAPQDRAEIDATFDRIVDQAREAGVQAKEGDVT